MLQQDSRRNVNVQLKTAQSKIGSGNLKKNRLIKFAFIKNSDVINIIIAILIYLQKNNFEYFDVECDQDECVPLFHSKHTLQANAFFHLKIKSVNSL